MIYKLHYFFVVAGANAIGILLGIFMETYTDASTTEVGMLLMLMPFTGIVFRPLICSMADRNQAHRRYLMWCLFIAGISYSPFIIVPAIGPCLYEQHPRFCWYLLLVVKVIGDIAFGGVISLGDSLAINYSKRIKVEFSVYRIWGTVSWMLFGVITGHINEVSFLPKYVPAFIVLVTATFLNMLCVYLWPPEYFLIVPIENHSNDGKPNNKQTSSAIKTTNAQLFTKSLMPREVVWAHAKQQLYRLVPFCGKKHERQMRNSITPIIQKHIGNNSPGPPSLATLTVETLIADSTKRANSRHQHETLPVAPEHNKDDEIKLTKRMQIDILMLLMRRDLRLAPYLIAFIFSGFSVAPLSFFIMSLPLRCNSSSNCDFSQLAGLVQVSMAGAELVMLYYIKRLIKLFGRLNIYSFAFVCCGLKYAFYATYWHCVNPHYALLIECLQGLLFAVHLTVSIEMGHLFSAQVSKILPELEQRSIIPSMRDMPPALAVANLVKIKLSLAATLQAVIGSFMDGIGRGCGALFYGLIVDRYSFDTLWACVAIGSACIIVVTQFINILDTVLKFNLGLRSEPSPLDLRSLAALEDNKQSSLSCDNDKRRETINSV